MLRKNMNSMSALLTLSLSLLALPALAETGVSATEIKLGMANATSGPAAALGTGVKSGSEAFFKRINGAGGIHGRKIMLVSEDDGYEPSRTAAATEKLIAKDGVFGLFGYVGTPTSKAALPFVNKDKIPFFSPFTGAEFLRTPVSKQVFNVRASYNAEIEMQVERLVSDLGVRRIGIFIQDDTYGNVGREGVLLALKKRKMELVGEGRYKRNSEDVEAGLAALKLANPEAVIMVGTYGACASFVKKANVAGFKPRLFNLSFVGTSDFIKAAGADGENVYITQVVPSPADESVPIVRQYLADMRAAGHKDISYTSLEGYISAAVLAEGLKAAGPDLTRDALVAALERLNTSVGGLAVSFDPSNHQGLKQVYLTKVQKGRAVPVDKLN